MQGKHAMNSSLWCADITTHIKIVAVSLMAMIFVVTIGICTPTSDVITRNNVDAPVTIKAGKPAIFTTSDSFAIR
jgi:hypothetical protein